MARPFVYSLALIVFVLALVLWASGAWAQGRLANGVGQPSLRHMPPKDCTRINGRYGYHGNPWCNQAEQLRWNRWTARRRARSRID